MQDQIAYAIALTSNNVKLAIYIYSLAHNTKGTFLKNYSSAINFTISWYHSIDSLFKKVSHKILTIGH